MEYAIIMSHRSKEMQRYINDNAKRGFTAQGGLSMTFIPTGPDMGFQYALLMVRPAKEVVEAKGEGGKRLTRRNRK